MKKVLILYGRSDWKKSKPFENKRYQYSYEYFYDLCGHNGIQMYRASYEWYDNEKNIFKHAWLFEGFGGRWKKVNNIKPNLIYDKTTGRLEVHYKKELIRAYYPFVNDIFFTMTIDDKFITGLIFAKWSKKNWIVRSTEQLLSYSKNIGTSKIVIKPIAKSGGKDILILPKSKITNVKIKEEMIIQEFIDSSRGVPGVTSGTHDLRLVFVNSKLIYAYTRKPRKGSYLANLAQGGSLQIVPNRKIPKSVRPIVRYANQVFESYEPRIFTIDLMFDENRRPWIVELNSMPGLYFTPAEKPSMMKMYEELLKVFKRKLGNL
jgi:glutathione synthase/RimK-type ligase-like ATP-grasp enzyme